MADPSGDDSVSARYKTIPYPRSTLPALIQQTQADIASRLQGINPWLPFSDLQVLAYVFAGLQYSQFGYLDYIAKQAIPVTSTGEALEAWASLKGITRLVASRATGQVTFTGSVQAFVPDGTQLIRSDGIVYQIPINFGGAIGSDGTFTTTIEAVDPGALGNLTIGVTPMTLLTPLPGVSPSVAVISNFIGGADAESDISLQRRMIDIYSHPPQGGALSDYQTWSREIPIVTRVWDAGPTFMGAGTVSIFFCADVEQAAFAGIPQGTNGGSTFEARNPTATGDQLAVANHIYPKRSATALVWVFAPVAVPIPITIQGIGADPTLQQAVGAAYNATFIRTASPVGVTLDDLTQGGSMFLSDVEDAIAAVPGVSNFVIHSWNGATPDNLTLTVNGQLPVPGFIQFI